MLMPSILNDSLLDDLMNFTFVPETREYHHPAGMMKTDVRELDNSYELDIDLPGYEKENVSAELKDGYLVIEASAKEEKDEKDDKGTYIRRERYMGSMSRSYYVGENITEDDISARFENGTLKVSIPKKDAKEIEEQRHYVAIEG